MDNDVCATQRSMFIEVSDGRRHAGRHLVSLITWSCVVFDHRWRCARATGVDLCVPRPSCTDRMHLREVVTVAISWPGSKDGFAAPPVAVPQAPRFLARPSRSVLERGDVSLVSGSSSFCELVSDPV